MMRKFVVLGLLGLFVFLGASNGISNTNGCATGSCSPDVDFNGRQNIQQINVTGFIKDLAKKALGFLSLPAEAAVDAIATLVKLKITVNQERFASANLTCSQCTSGCNNGALVTQLVVNIQNSSGVDVGSFGGDPQQQPLEQRIRSVQNAQTLDSKALATAIFGNLGLLTAKGTGGAFGFTSSSQGFGFSLSGRCTCVAGSSNTKLTCANKPIPHISGPADFRTPNTDVPIILPIQVTGETDNIIVKGGTTIGEVRNSAGFITSVTILVDPTSDFVSVRADEAGVEPGKGGGCGRISKTFTVLGVGQRNYPPTVKGFPMDAPVGVAEAADLDGDGASEIVATLTRKLADLVVLKVGGIGQLDMSSPVTGLEPLPLAMTAGDVDGDGIEDVVALSIRFEARVADSSVKLIVTEGVLTRISQNASGQLQATDFVIPSWQEGNTPWALTGLAVGQFDGEGLPDVGFTLNDIVPTRVLTQQDQAFGFSKEDRLPCKGGALFNADLDGNGQAELVISTIGTAYTCILWNGSHDAQVRRPGSVRVVRFLGRE